VRPFRYALLPPPRRSCFRRCLFVCLSVSNFVQELPNGFALTFTEDWTNEQMIKFWWRSGSDFDIGIVVRMRHYWEIRKMVSTECDARRCSGGHALADIAIATMTSLRHRSTTDSHVSR